MVKKTVDSNYFNKQLIDEPCVNNLIPRSQPRNDPQGCYILNKNFKDAFDGLSSLNFSDPYRDEDKTLMDPGLCVNHCGNYLFKYAALGNGTDCRCGKDSTLQSYDKVDEFSNCNITCVGNVTDKCGGKKAYTVYDTSELPDEKKPKITIEEKLFIINNLTNNLWYRGCIKDNPECSNRELNGASDKFPSMTVDYCLDFCRKNSYKYAGLEIGNECFCDNSYRFSFLKIEECSSSCVGNKYQICGGPLALSVYEVEATTSLVSSPTTTSVPSKNHKLEIGLGTGIPGGMVFLAFFGLGIYRHFTGKWPWK